MLRGPGEEASGEFIVESERSVPLILIETLEWIEEGFDVHSAMDDDPAARGDNLRLFHG